MKKFKDKNSVRKTIVDIVNLINKKLKTVKTFFIGKYSYIYKLISLFIYKQFIYFTSIDILQSFN